MPFIVKMPKLSPTMEEGTIAKWHKQEGEYVAAGELLVEITTDKATLEHTALDEGWLRKILVKEGQSAHINHPLAIFTVEKDENIVDFKLPSQPPPPKLEEVIEIKEDVRPSAPLFSQPAFVPEPPLSSLPLSHLDEKAPASPLARRLAKEQGLDLRSVSGSGPGGRITSQDLTQAQPEGLVTFGRREEPTLPGGTYSEIPLPAIRKVIAKRLQESKSFVPHFYVQQVIDAEPLIQLRSQLKAHGLAVTINDLILRGSALALRAHPGVNSGFNSINQTIIQFKTVDISVAVTIDGGLITPIIRHADFKNVGQISSEMRSLAEKGRAMKLKEEEYKGGSFCLSNLGMWGITSFAAVINPPQAAILAIGSIEERAVVKAGVVAPGKTLALTLSADHRVIDGTLAAQFLKTVQKLLENPAALIV
jgi:pyruvate dehydrogenase E2 component (dihydrolipoamide acetyltransferase)